MCVSHTLTARYVSISMANRGKSTIIMLHGAYLRCCEMVRFLVGLIVCLSVAACTGNSWWHTYSYDSSGNVWSNKKCSTHCATVSDDGRTCVVYHEIAQPYCNQWVDY